MVISVEDGENSFSQLQSVASSHTSSSVGLAQLYHKAPPPSTGRLSVCVTEIVCLVKTRCSRPCKLPPICLIVARLSLHIWTTEAGQSRGASAALLCYFTQRC